MVSLEVAFALPLLLFCCLVGGWILHLGQAQAQLHDAARAVARQAARGGSEASAIAAGEQVLGGSQFALDRSSGWVRVSARYSVSAPGLLNDRFHRDLAAEVTAATEGGAS